jgi:hypothetical protein
MEWISMENNIFEIFIRDCGTVEKAAEILGTSHQNLCSMRNGHTWAKFKFAKKIEKYLWEKLKYKIDPLDLISPLDRIDLKSLSQPFMHHPIKLMNVSITHVKCDFSAPSLIHRDQRPLNQFRPIIIDENQQLIANPSTYLVYQKQNKKTVPAWLFSLPDLLTKKYELVVLVQTFLICERAAIGIAAKKCLGNRQGPRFHKPIRRNFDEITGRTDELISSLLGFGCKDSYRHTEKIQLFGSTELIQSVNEGTLKISAAAQLTRFNHKQQREILALNKKEILNYVYTLKRER